MQLRVSVELYAARTVGDRLRDGRPADTADHPTEQVSRSGVTRRPEGRIVSRKEDVGWNRVVGLAAVTYFCTRWLCILYSSVVYVFVMV